MLKDLQLPKTSNEYSDEDIAFDDETVDDFDEYEEGVAEEESMKNKRFDPVENFQYELPDDFEELQLPKTFNEHSDEDISSDDEVVNDFYVYEEGVAEEESKKNKRFDPVENFHDLVDSLEKRNARVFESKSEPVITIKYRLIAELKRKNRGGGSSQNKGRKDFKKRKQNSHKGKDGRRKGPRLPKAMLKVLQLPKIFNEHSDEDISSSDEAVNDFFENEEGVAEEESKKNKRFDHVENFQYELPYDFEIELLEAKSAKMFGTKGVLFFFFVNGGKDMEFLLAYFGGQKKFLRANQNLDGGVEEQKQRRREQTKKGRKDIKKRKQNLHEDIASDDEAVNDFYDNEEGVAEEESKKNKLFDLVENSMMAKLKRKNRGGGSRQNKGRKDFKKRKQNSHEEGIVEEESKKNKRFDPVKNFQYELPYDFEESFDLWLDFLMSEFYYGRISLD
ncbi:uncharacterized protein [Nicotiana sylvestris]|uniref:uncharacterized protein n=1 Tax=Nicotiana sylvestris TaxID=4096 RepID=UPI00388CE77B